MDTEILDAWCASVPGLAKLETGAWEDDRTSDISYPDDDLALLAGLEERSYWFQHRNDVIASVVRQFPPQGPIFDIGGGNGFVSLGLRAAGFPAIVVEPEKAGVLTARRRGLPTILAAFQNLQAKPGSVPAAGLFDVLEHIEDEAGALARLSEVLPKGGLAYIAVPAFQFLWSKDDVHAGHFRRYTLERLENALRQAGLAPLFGTYFFSALVPAVWAVRSLPSQIGRREAKGSSHVKEHTLPTGVIGNVLKRSFAWELNTVNAGKSVRFGTSVLVVARKA